MKYTMYGAKILLVAIFFFSECFGFSSSKPSAIVGNRLHFLQQQKQPKASTKAFLLQQTTSSSTDGRAAATPLPHNVPLFVYKLNASTKWLVAVACTLGVWTRVQHYEGPFVIVGSILATYFTVYLKKVWNQSRPDGAPFADPGMPSSHSLISFFLAIAWSTLVLPSSTSSPSLASGLLLASAAIIALLRVICGYHSWAQIAVGTVLGCGMGFSWAKLGSLVATHGHPRAVFRASWTTYLAGSTFYIVKTIRPWLYEEKHL